MFKNSKRIRVTVMAGFLVMSLMTPLAVPVARVVPGFPQITTQAEAKAKLTKKQARKKLIQYLKDVGIWKSGYKAEYDSTEGNKYLFHVYENVDDHTATVGWYYVNKNNGKITSMF